VYSTCNYRPKKRQSANSGRWISIFSKQEYAHNPNCPQFARADYARTVAAQLTVCNRIVGICIQPGWQKSKSGGWNTIAPVLRCRTVVPQTLGVFKILSDARDVISEMTSPGRPSRRVDYIISTVSTALQKSFGKDSSPEDVDEDGNSMLQVCFPVQSVYMKLNNSGGLALTRFCIRIQPAICQFDIYFCAHLCTSKCFVRSTELLGNVRLLSLRMKSYWCLQSICCVLAESGDTCGYCFPII
jgi:hypothetical protein